MCAIGEQLMQSESEDKMLYLISPSVMPKIIHKVVEAKRLLETGEASNISVAVSQAGISRSVYYKYHDKVQPFYDHKNHQTLTMAMDLLDVSGILGEVLSEVSNHGANVLTINQSVPIHRIAHITLTIEITTDSTNVQELVEAIESKPAVRTIKIVARE